MKTIAQKRNTLILLASGAVAIAWLGSHNGPSPSARYNVPEVDLSQAKALVEAGAIVIDVRSKEAFDHRHLPPAVLIPLAVLRAAIPSSLAEAKERQIVVYCNDGHATGPEAAQILLQHGYKNVVNMKSGIEGWANAGLPIVRAS